MDDFPKDKYGRPRVFLEGDDVPVEELSIECQRERGASSALPPLYFLHVWWARRPLTISRAAVLGSLLPENYNKTDFLELMGIPRGKDPIAAKKIINEVISGIRKDRVKDPYGYPRAFTKNPSESEINELKKIYENIWNQSTLTILDSFAGGGSIPFEAYRYSLNIILNELNPVASIIERATIEYPSIFGLELMEEIKYWGEKIEKKIENELKDCFPKNVGEEDLCYIWVRTVTCPSCELKVPLAPNWWLDKSNKIGYQLVVPTTGNECGFVLKQESDNFDPNQGTITRSVGKCPKCKEVIESEDIKRQAKENKMGHQLVVVGYKTRTKKGRQFREVNDMDLKGVYQAEQMLKMRLPMWKTTGLLPDEVRSINYRMDTIYQYGIDKWYHAFNKRQLLVHLITLENIINQPWEKIENKKKIEAIKVYMYMIFGKCLNYNSLQSNWHPSRTVIANTFDRHDYSFKWSTGEIDGAGVLFRFGLNQIIDSYKGICKIFQFNEGNEIKFLVNDAADINCISNSSVDSIVIDPPYYDNVQYADLSDFFYVWMKRSIGDIFPDLFSTELTNKDKEAVANYSRFLDSAKGQARKLSIQDYEAKMAAAFREQYRVLREDGVMTVMFTHKKVEAWDTLSRSLMDSGFEITASWPIHTESEHSLHQAKKNAAASTILLICRKRPKNTGTGWWEELKPILEQKVMEKAEKFESHGIRRLDLSIACFGTALEVISEKWPVKKGDGTIISPDEALDAARKVVTQWFMDKITFGEKKVVDPATQFYILAWYIFQAREFPFDEAHKLSLSVGYSIDDLVKRKILKKKSNNVEIQKPTDRARDGGLKAGLKEYDWDIDYVQSAILAFQTEGAKGLQRFHTNTDAMERPGYRNAISYLLDVLPRTKEINEYFDLNSMWESNFKGKISRNKPVQQDPSTYKQTKLELGESK